MSQPQKYDYRYYIRRLILIGIDSLLIVFSLIIYLRFFHHTGFSADSLFKNPLWISLIIVLWFFYATIFSLYRLSNVGKVSETVRNTFITAVLTGITYIFIPFLGPTLPLHRLPAFVLIGTMFFFVIFWRLLYARFFQHPVFTKRAVIIGAGYTGRELANTLINNEKIYHNTGYKIYGFIDDDENKTGKIYDDLKVIGSSKSLLKYARRLKIDELIVSIPEGELSSELYSYIIECETGKIAIIQATDLYESQTGKVMVKQKKDKYHLTNPYSIFRVNRFYQVTNRIINILCSLLAGIFFSLVLPFVWLANLMFSSGPLFFMQERVGKNGRTFNIIKFRTMIVDAEKNTGPQFAAINDERITPIGKFLRKTRLDELPQFWNILRGDMNMIGPRPEREYFVIELTRTIPFFKLRNTVKPGLSGWAQVNHKYAADADEALIKLQYDLYYIKHRSFFLDLRIIFKTISVMLKFKGT